MNLTEALPVLQGIAAGKPWQFFNHSSDRWVDGSGCIILLTAHCYTLRLKPWQLPDPPAGERWHRTDWTEDMLPEGYRPLLHGEMRESNMDEVENDEPPHRGKWYVWNKHHPAHHSNWIVSAYSSRTRTRRPLPVDPPQPDKDGWIPWRGGKCPVDGETEIEYKTRSGVSFCLPAKSLRWDHCGASNDVVAYRIVPPPVMVPLGPEDVPPGSVFRWAPGQVGWANTAYVATHGVYLCDGGDAGVWIWDRLRDKAEILRPGRDPVTGWERCEKEGGRPS